MAAAEISLAASARASADRRATNRAAGASCQAREFARRIGNPDRATWVSAANKEIARRLYLSHRTVGAHLYRIFPKLGISSRAALRDALTRSAHPV